VTSLHPATSLSLLFVYNANAGIAAGIIDSIHKVVSPSTYSCDLCALSYGLARMNPQWRDWLRDLPIETTFFHKPDFSEAWPNNREQLPAVFLCRDGDLQILLSAAEFKALDSVDSLIGRLETLLRERGMDFASKQN
jgi:hypothetical protein